jgi:hypothetical protein
VLVVSRAAGALREGWAVGLLCVKLPHRVVTMPLCADPVGSIGAALLLCVPVCAAGLPVKDLERHPSGAAAAEGYGCQDDEGAYRGPQAGELGSAL